jgi:hypothetical protein
MTNKIFKLFESGKEVLRNSNEMVADFLGLAVATTPTADLDVANKKYVDDNYIPADAVGQPLGVAGLDEDGMLPSDIIPAAGSSLLGTPTDGSYDEGLLTLVGTMPVADMADQVNLILAKLAPPKPANLSTKTLSLASTTYSASAAGTGAVHSVCTSSLRPQSNTLSGFYDGDAGTLSVEIDGLASGSRALSAASDVSTNGSLVITADADPYLGVNGQAGFWKALTAYALPSSDLSYAGHTMQMKHSVSGNTNLLQFYVDNPATVTISGASVTVPASTRYVSGVPSLASGASVTLSFNVLNAVRKHYRTTNISDVSSSYASTWSSGASPVYAEGATINVTGASVTVNGSVYTEDVPVTIKGYSSNGTSGTATIVQLGARADTVSDESARRVSGSGQYPSSGYGGAFVSTTSLRSVYTEELQMLNGKYRRPTGNYTLNAITAGPDYSTGMGSSIRWVTFAPVTLSGKSAFTLTINGVSGTWSGIETSDISIYAKVEGSSFWVNCNASYPGTGDPGTSADGNPAMVFSESSSTVKKVTFGTVARSGLLYIRIGIPVSGADKQFSSISVSVV